MEYEFIVDLAAEEYRQRLSDRWRRFGGTLFRPHCSGCNACEPIRTIVSEFRPNRSQRRVKNANAEATHLKIVSPPTISDEKLDLYYRHHFHHSEQKNWPRPDRQSILNHLNLITDVCYPTQEWNFFRDGKLIGVLFVDEVGDGYSGVYFYYDPDYRHLSLGTWMCLSMIERALASGFSYVYLGYLVRGCRSMEYKAGFKPYELLGMDGVWRKELETGNKSD